MQAETGQTLKPAIRPELPMPLWEFVGMIAAMMALNALAIDTMLPALHNIAQSYALEEANDQQLVIFAYVLLTKHRLGFAIRVTGEAPRAARFSGVNPARLVLFCLGTSGLLAGLAGTGDHVEVGGHVLAGGERRLGDFFSFRLLL